MKRLFATILLGITGYGVFRIMGPDQAATFALWLIEGWAATVIAKEMLNWR